MASLSSKARRRWEYCGLSRSLARSLSSLLAWPGLRQTGRVVTQNTRGGTGRTTRGLREDTGLEREDTGPEREDTPQQQREKFHIEHVCFVLK